MGQSRKDSKQKRVNFDNTRVSKFDRDMKKKQASRRSKPQSPRRSQRDRETTSVDGTNDVSWYAKTPELLRAAASVPFSVVNGQPIPVSVENTMSIPNTLALYWNPIVGGMGDEAINQAADSMYSFTVHANSRNYRYNAPDLMLLVLAGASFFSMLALGIRTYGILKTYDQRNMYLPNDWISLSGFDPDDLKKNMSQMWFDLNQLIAMSQQIWIPNTMPVITRWFWMNSNIYMDANSAKAQYYMYVPRTYWQYNETADEHGGCLQAYTWAMNYQGPTTNLKFGTLAKHTWAEYMQVMQTMLAQLVNSEDRGIIFGDLLKAYGSEKIYSISPITSDYTVTPVYNPEVLTQIENCVAWPYAPSANSIFSTGSYGAAQSGVYQNQDTVRLYSRVLCKASTNYETSDTYFAANRLVPLRPFLNFHQQATPTPEQVMVATRLMACGIRVTEGRPTDTGPWFAPAACGTEYVSDIKYSVYSYDASLKAWAVGTDEYYQCRSYEYKFTKPTGQVGYSISSGLFMEYATFDWAPIYYLNMPGGDITSTERSAIVNTPNYVLQSSNPWTALCDFDNWTTLDLSVLSKMHTAAIYSEFGVPVII